jgi:GTPase SAR1 family protein
MSFKIALMGERESGKTTYLNKLYYKYFTENHLPTRKTYSVHNFQIASNDDMVYLEIVDFSNENDFTSSQFDNITDLNAVIIFLDRRNTLSINTMPYRINNIRKHFPNVKIVIVANKSDLILTRTSSKYNHLKPLCDYFIDDFSIKTTENITQPILSAYRLLVKNDNIQFI